MKIWGFKELERNECSLNPFHSLPLKLSNNHSLKLPNEGMEKYFKLIIFIHFHFIMFPPPKWGLKETKSCNHFILGLFLWSSRLASGSILEFILFVLSNWFHGSHRWCSSLAMDIFTGSSLNFLRILCLYVRILLIYHLLAHPYNVIMLF